MALFGENKVVDKEIYERYIEQKYRKQRIKNIIDKDYQFTDEDFKMLFKIHKEKRKEMIRNWKFEVKK